MESESEGAPDCFWRFPVRDHEVRASRALAGAGGFHCLLSDGSVEFARAALTILAVLLVVLWKRYSRGRKIAAALNELKEESAAQVEVLDRLVIKYKEEEVEREKSSSISAEGDTLGSEKKDSVGGKVQSALGNASLKEDAAKPDPAAGEDRTVVGKGGVEGVAAKTSPVAGEAESVEEEGGIKEIATKSSPVDGEAKSIERSGAGEDASKATPADGEGKDVKRRSVEGDVAIATLADGESKSVKERGRVGEDASKTTVSSLSTIASSLDEHEDQANGRAKRGEPNSTQEKGEGGQLQNGSVTKERLIARPLEGKQTSDGTNTVSLVDGEGIVPEDVTENGKVLDATTSLCEEHSGEQDDRSTPPTLQQITEESVPIQCTVVPLVENGSGESKNSGVSTGQREGEGALSTLSSDNSHCIEENGNGEGNGTESLERESSSSPAVLSLEVQNFQGNGSMHEKVCKPTEPEERGESLPSVSANGHDVPQIGSEVDSAEGQDDRGSDSKGDQVSEATAPKRREESSTFSSANGHSEAEDGSTNGEVSVSEPTAPSEKGESTSPIFSSSNGKGGSQGANGMDSEESLSGPEERSGSISCASSRVKIHDGEANGTTNGMVSKPPATQKLDNGRSDKGSGLIEENESEAVAPHPGINVSIASVDGPGVKGNDSMGRNGSTVGNTESRPNVPLDSEQGNQSGSCIVSSVDATGRGENGREETPPPHKDEASSCGTIQSRENTDNQEDTTSASPLISSVDGGQGGGKLDRTKDISPEAIRKPNDISSLATAAPVDDCLANVENIPTDLESKPTDHNSDKSVGGIAASEKPTPPSEEDGTAPEGEGLKKKEKRKEESSVGEEKESVKAGGEQDDKSTAKENGTEDGGESKSPAPPRRTAPITVCFRPPAATPDKDVKPVIELVKKLSVPLTPGRPISWTAVQGSFIQTHVELNDELIEKLSNIVKEAAKVDKKCTLQLDSRIIFENNGKGVQIMNLRETPVPEIIEAEYVAGVLGIKGIHLDGSVVKAATKRKCIVLNMTLREKRSGGVEVLSCMEPMPLRDLDEVFIFATRDVEVEGHTVSVLSKSTWISDAHLKTAVHHWIPTLVMTILVAREVWIIARPFLQVGILYGAWILPAVAIVLLQLLPTRAEDFIRDSARTIAVCSKLSIQGTLRFMKSKSKLDHSSSKPPPPKPPPPPPPPPEAKLDKEKEKPITDPDWQWPSFDEYLDKGLPKLKEQSAAPDAKNSPFQAIYKREVEQQWADVVSVNLLSPILIKIVQSFLPHKKDMLYMEKPSVKGKDLFLIMDKLLDYKVTEEDQKSIEEKAGLDLETCKLHVHHLCRFVKKEYNDVTVRFERMKDEKSVAWDMLWAFLGPDTKVAYTCATSEEKLLARVKSTMFHHSIFRKNNPWTLNVVLEVYDYNGECYRKCTLTKYMDQFDGEQDFISLDVYPLEFADDPSALEAACIGNGRKFCEFVMKDKHRYVHYKGPIFQLRNTGGFWSLFSANADGRVMIDLESFAKMNPKYPMGNAKPSGALLRSNSHQMPKAVTDNATDENLLYAPAIVYGFSFSQKQWGAFTVSGFNDITFNRNAYEELVMESEEKALMYNLVSQYISRKPLFNVENDDDDESRRVDPISNKGEGCIFLCYGPPGTGKTLTAESIAEKLERPLWALSVSELGTSADRLESSLVRVLDIAAKWRAVLLLDEADVYLELRKNTDIHRNAMTGVFLRLLEYYRGVLFLTTNRVLTFDDAFLSRISMFLNYKKLELLQRQQIWSKLLMRAGVQDLTPEFVTELATQDHQGLNGRAIRNVVQTAQTWAKSQNESLKVKHVRHVLKVTTASLGSLHSAMGMVDLTPFYYT